MIMVWCWHCFVLYHSLFIFSSLRAIFFITVTTTIVSRPLYGLICISRHNWRILLVQSFTACMPLLFASQHIRIREKMLELSSAVFYTISMPYLFITVTVLQFIDSASRVCVSIYIMMLCLSICLSVPSYFAAAVYGVFAAVGSACGQYRSIAAQHVCQFRSISTVARRSAVSCLQQHRKLNTTC